MRRLGKIERISAAAGHSKLFQASENLSRRYFHSAFSRRRASLTIKSRTGLRGAKMLVLDAPVSHVYGSFHNERGDQLKKNVPPVQSVPSLDLTEVPAVRIGEKLPELIAAFRLVYQRYAERGLVNGRPNGIIYSSEFARGDRRTLVATKANGQITATATFIAEPEDTSADAVIPWRLIKSYDPTRRLGGVTCLASLGNTSGPSPAAFFCTRPLPISIRQASRLRWAGDHHPSPTASIL
jgi:hypothetical protein